LGNPENFVGGDPSKDPIQGNQLGTIHKGGLIVVLLISFQFILMAYAVERFTATKYSMSYVDISDFELKRKNSCATST
jgi:biopolymer transport protein ExbB